MSDMNTIEYFYIQLPDGTMKKTQIKTNDIAVDSALDEKSANPVQNKIIAKKIKEIEDMLGGGNHTDIEENGGLEFDATTGKLQLQEEYLEYLEKQTYAKPTISSFSLTGASDIYYAVGDSIKITGISYTLTNKNNISGNYLSLSVGGATIKSDISKSASSADVNNTQSSNTEKTVSYVLSGTDTKNQSFSKTITKYFVHPFYYGGYSNEAVGENFNTILTKHGLTNSETFYITVELKTEGYIHIVTPKTIKEIKNTETNFVVDCKLIGKIGQTDYNDYSTVKMSAGTYKYTVTLV